MIYFARVDFGRFSLLLGEGRPAKYDMYLIKIGKSKHPLLRMSSLSRLYRRNVTLLAAIPGDAEEELSMHRRFANLRIPKARGAPPPELFFPARELIDFVASLGESKVLAGQEGL